MADPASVLHEFQHNIILVEDPIVNEISSTKIRSELCKVWGNSFTSGACESTKYESTLRIKQCAVLACHMKSSDMKFVHITGAHCSIFAA